MEDFPFSEQIIEQLKVEFKKWQDFLNFVLGVFSFNAGLSCLGLKSSQNFAWAALMFFLVIGVAGFSNFPPIYIRLRDKKERTEQGRNRRGQPST